METMIQRECQKCKVISRAKENVRFFGEMAPFHGEQEKEEATQYLLSWKKFLLRRLSSEIIEIEVEDEQWIEKDPLHFSPLGIYGSLVLKLAIRGKYKYELGFD